LPTECRRKSLLWLHQPSRSRSSLPQNESTPSGSVDLSWLLSPPSSRCGSPSKNTTSLAQESSTGNASKYFNYCSTTSLIIILLSNYICNTTPPQHLSTTITTSRANPSEIKYPSSNKHETRPHPTPDENVIHLKRSEQTNSKSSDGRARRAISIINQHQPIKEQQQKQQHHKNNFHHEHHHSLLIINCNKFIVIYSLFSYNFIFNPNVVIVLNLM